MFMPMLEAPPHAIVCMTKLLSILSVYATNEDLYYHKIAEALEKSTNLRKDQLSDAAIQWGNIHNKEFMNKLVEIIQMGAFMLCDRTDKSICLVCDCGIDGKCIKESKIKAMDEKTADILNLKIYTLRGIPTNVYDLKPNPRFEEVCDICGNKKKCALLKQAFESPI